MFKPNEGAADRIIRIIIGIVLLVAANLYLGNVAQIIVYIIGAIIILTGLTGYCGLYSILGISTCPMKKPE